MDIEEEEDENDLNQAKNIDPLHLLDNQDKFADILIVGTKNNLIYILVEKNKKIIDTYIFSTLKV